MVTALILGWIIAALAGIIGALPHPELPSWLSDGIPTWFLDGLSWAVQMDHWIPVQAIGLGIAFLLICSGLAIVIRIARIVISLVTFGGGSAA